MRRADDRANKKTVTLQVLGERKKYGVQREIIQGKIHGLERRLARLNRAKLPANLVVKAQLCTR